MPVKGDITLNLTDGEVFRREGFREYSRIRPEIKSLIQELLASVKNAHLLEPSIAYEIYHVTGIDHHQVFLDNNLVLQCSLLSSLFPEIKELVAVVGTIGPKLEKQVTNYMNQDEPLRGVLLDGIGSAAVDCLMQEVCNFIEVEASSQSYQSSSPVSPGMPGFPITEQWPLLKLAHASQIGVSLTSSGIMIPRKSTSMVIGLGPRMVKWARSEVCAHCSLGKTCHYRIHD